MKRSPLKKQNRKRLKALRERQFGDKGRWIRNLKCCICKGFPVDPHHVKSRGAGGTSKDLVPLCRACHHLYHAKGGTNAKLVMENEARFLEKYWQENREECMEVINNGVPSCESS